MLMYTSGTTAMPRLAEASNMLNPIWLWVKTLGSFLGLRTHFKTNFEGSLGVLSSHID